MKRRGFIAGLAGCALGGECLPRVFGGPAHAQDALDFALPDGDAQPVAVPARHYEKLDGKKIICKLCPRECRVADSERGYCGVRENRGGEYFTLVHGRAAAVHLDPIEKKPLFHFLPGTQAFSLGTAGCNMECRFCQNWEISQFRPEQVKLLEASAEFVCDVALRAGAPTIAYTYNEPSIFYEYMFDIAQLGAGRGLRSVVISNGYLSEAPLRELAPYLAAFKVDLKAFSEDFYREQCSAELKPVLDTLVRLKSLGPWMEIVLLIIPTLNDDVASNRRMFRWIRTELGADVPLHLTRFHPTYKITNLPATPIETLVSLRAIAREEGLRYVYVGNAPGHAAESTRCPDCDELLIERYAFVVSKNALKNGCCPKCGRAIPGVWS